MIRLIQIICLLISFIFSPIVKSVENPSTAFYYAPNPPLDLLATYERVVLEAENIQHEELAYLQKKGVEVYAYLSIGEIDRTRPWYKRIKKTWKRGKNEAWNSDIMNMQSTGWHDFLLNQRMKALWKRGYRGFFLDTMDSYHLFAKTPVEKQQQQQGMVTLLKKMKQQYKGSHLLFNRGFEILEQAATLADGIVAESLFDGWVSNQYQAVKAPDREWLLGKLNEAKDKYQLNVTVIDYLPPEQREKAQETAKKIKALGFIPWVSNPALDYMGVGSRHLIPRKVLFIYNSNEQPLFAHEIHRFLAMPLEYQGYIPDYYDLAKKSLSSLPLKGRYAGVVFWLNPKQIKKDDLLASWVSKQVKHKLPVAFMGRYILRGNPDLNQQLGIDFQGKDLEAPLRLEGFSEHIGYEVKPVLRQTELPIIKSPTSEAWLKIIDASGEELTPVFISSWGGVAINPYVIQAVPVLGGEEGEEEVHWVINPFEFLKAALKLKTIPIPDHTTENGNRILTIHIDGDGFYNKTELGGDRYSSELIMEDFLIPGSLPHTVSIIEGEIAKTGLKPDLSPKLEAIARTIFKLDNIEIASHSFSHPFDWVLADKTKNDKPTISEKKKAKQSKDVFKAEKGKYHLPIPKYSYSAEREVKGSIDYIDNFLAPPNKRTKVFLWTGDCLPHEEALMWTKKMKVVNLNGGDTVIRKGKTSITNVASLGIVTGKYFQPYAQIQNENLYTNDWTGPFYGFQRVIETFEMTDQPRRFKPISIYYHFYSGDRLASVRALRRVYDWAIQQETMPLWISEYTPRLDAFRQVVYEKLEQGWRFYHAEDMTTLRFENQSLHPDMKNSSGVMGYRKLAQGMYVAFDKKSIKTVTLMEKKNTTPYLHNANASAKYWKKTQQGVQFRLAGHQPVMFHLAGLSHRCSLQTKAGKKIKGSKQTDNSYLFNMETHDTGALQVICG